MDFGPLIENVFIVIPLLTIMGLALLVSAINILSKKQLNLKEKIYISVLFMAFLILLIKYNYF